MRLATRALLALLVLGCSAQQRTETARAVKVFECEVAVLAPYVPDALSAEKLVEGVVTGAVSLPVALTRLGVPVKQANAAIDDFNVCFAGAQEELAPPPEALPAGESSRLVAPPPAYGNRVL